MSSTDDTWELKPENGHPVAKRVLKDSFFWSIADDGAPLGSDTGSDTLAFYRGWRAENLTTPAAAFVQKTLVGWEVAVSTESLDEHELKKALDDDHFSILTRDDFMIAVAFAQLVLEGRVDPDIRTQALHSIQRQATEVVIAFRGWVSPKERRGRLAKMRMALEGA